MSRNETRVSEAWAKQADGRDKTGDGALAFGTLCGVVEGTSVLDGELAVTRRESVESSACASWAMLRKHGRRGRRRSEKTRWRWEESRGRKTVTQIHFRFRSLETE